MTNHTAVTVSITLLVVLASSLSMGSWYLFMGHQRQFKISSTEALLTKFTYLATHGNSSCGDSFTDSIAQQPESARLLGSCCSPMDWYRYREQVGGLKKYSGIKEIPPDPYNIDAGLAKRMKAYYDTELTPEEQMAYDYALQNSAEKGPCCCKCWRWYVYGGLGKYLIRHYQFTGQRVTQVWNLSDGCGGEGDHLEHS